MLETQQRYIDISEGAISASLLFNTAFDDVLENILREENITMQYKHINFEEQLEKHNEKSWYLIKNNKSGDVLGKVYFYKPWKKYTVTFKEVAVFDEGCLKDIIDFIGQLKI
jgi:hypothetical protein